jgi:hypothetical protein
MAQGFPAGEGHWSHHITAMMDKLAVAAGFAHGVTWMDEYTCCLETGDPFARTLYCRVRPFPGCHFFFGIAVQEKLIRHEALV